MLEIFHEALSLGRSFEVEGRFRRSDGEFRWFLFRGSPLLDGSGKVVRWYGTNTDLEDRKRAEDALRASEQSFRLIVDGIAGLVAIMTSIDEVQAVNRQVLDYFGKTVEQLKGWSTSDAVHPDDLPGVISAWRRLGRDRVSSTMSITVCAVLTACIVGSTREASRWLTLMAGLSAGMSCSRTLMSANKRNRSCDVAKGESQTAGEPCVLHFHR